MKKKNNIFQAFNKRNQAWVKYKLDDSGFKPFDVKQREPLIPFKNIKKRGKRR